MSAAALVIVFAFTAFTVDVGYITLTKAELQKSADAAALGAVIELADAVGPGKLVTTTQAETNARAAAVAVAAANRAGGRSSTYADGNRDVRIGKYAWDSASGTACHAVGRTALQHGRGHVAPRSVRQQHGRRSARLVLRPGLGTQRSQLVRPVGGGDAGRCWLPQGSGSEHRHSANHARRADVGQPDPEWRRH